MQITIEIPKEFEKDFTDDKFNDFFERISADLEYVVCGRYEKEALKMMHHAFYDAQVIRLMECVNRQPKVHPIVRTPEEIAEMFDDMTSPHYCEKCPNETICETTWGVGCKQHWIDWLTGKV